MTWIVGLYSVKKYLAGICQVWEFVLGSVQNMFTVLKYLSWFLSWYFIATMEMKLEEILTQNWGADLATIKRNSWEFSQETKHVKPTLSYIIRRTMCSEMGDRATTFSMFINQTILEKRFPYKKH